MLQWFYGHGAVVLKTTIQVNDEVRERIEKPKAKLGLSYDQVIRKMIRAQMGKLESPFGAARCPKRFDRDIEEEHELAGN